MTAVCYDGELLAADRMARVKGRDGERRVVSLQQEKILVDFPTVIFDGEPIRAVGRAGVLKTSLFLIERLRASNDLAKDIETLGECLCSHFGDKKMGEASLLILTTNHTHIIKVKKNFRVHWRKEHRSKKLAIGSGVSTALFLMEHLGLNAADTVAAMELEHDSCGGGVMFTTRTLAQEETPVHALPQHQGASLKQHILHATVRAANLKLHSCTA